jgi:hypothetical protein
MFLADDNAERNNWRLTQRVGNLRAVFRAGEVLRCPGNKKLPSGKYGVCGQLIGSRAKPKTRVVVRVMRPGLPQISAGGLDFDTPCPNCGARLEQYVTPAVELEATG